MKLFFIVVLAIGVFAAVDASSGSDILVHGIVQAIHPQGCENVCVSRSEESADYSLVCTDSVLVKFRYRNDQRNEWVYVTTYACTWNRRPGVGERITVTIDPASGQAHDITCHMARMWIPK